MNTQRWIIGIDEAGRGPLAGPVAVGIVAVPIDFDWKCLPGVGDSKKVPEKNRKAIFLQAQTLKREGKLDFVVLLGSAVQIDTKGIAVVIRGLIEKGLRTLKQTPEECFVKLDGSLKAPKVYAQETIIKGDQKELVIGLASILAKETRDAHLVRLDRTYPVYGLALHKGYGTKSHRQLIATHGLSPVHRKTYCQNRHLWGKV